MSRWSGKRVSGVPRMRAVVTLSAILAAARVLAADVPGPGNGHYASPMEVAMLPQFCWAQYTEHRGPQYSIPPGCGPAMNHYCYGLVEELRANRVFGNPNHRLGLLRAAKSQTIYTINAMKPFPACPLRPHVEQTYQRIDARLRALGAR